MRCRVKKQAFYTTLFVLSVIIFLEVVLALLSFISPRIDTILSLPFEDSSPPRTVPDKRLGIRPSPEFPDHDSNGFRNPEVPERADVVALGDSQTYGTGVKSEEAWPRILEQMIAEPVYNMAYGGYGPVHSLILWDEAIALNPKLIIEGFYAGNDLFDSFNIVYNRGQFEELKSDDSQLQQSVHDAEEAEPIEEHVSRMFRMGETNNPADQKAFSLRGFLSKHSKIYGLLRRTRYQFKLLFVSPQDPWVKAKEFSAAHSKFTQVFNNDTFKTVFTSEYRLSALNLEDSRIAEGLNISLRAIQIMNERAAEKNIRFIVLLIPTKEASFQELWSNSPPVFNILAENESIFRATTKDFLNRYDIEYVDALPTLREQLANGVQPYKVSYDGHPNEHGHRAIAILMASYLKDP